MKSVITRSKSKESENTETTLKKLKSKNFSPFCKNISKYTFSIPESLDACLLKITKLRYKLLNRNPISGYAI